MMSRHELTESGQPVIRVSLRMTGQRRLMRLRGPEVRPLSRLERICNWMVSVSALDDHQCVLDLVQGLEHLLGRVRDNLT